MDKACAYSIDVEPGTNLELGVEEEKVSETRCAAGAK